MVSKEDVRIFVGNMLDKSRIQDYNIYCKLTKEQTVIGFSGKEGKESAQELIDGVKNDI